MAKPRASRAPSAVELAHEREGVVAHRSPRERILTAANDLFYAEGVHTVGIDRVIEHAGVAKQSLYNLFRSKDELVRAYLEGRADTRRKRILDRIARVEDPRERILAVFGLLGEIAAEPGFRGCAFVNASAEGPRDAGKVTDVCADMRGWTRELFTELARACQAPDPELLGRRLQLLYDGATVSASMDRDPEAANAAAEAAEALLDAAMSARRQRRKN